MNNDILEYLQTSKKNITLIYIFYFCGILYLWGVTIPIFPIIGVILAHINKEGSSGLLLTHYDFLIRTFWYSILVLIGAKILPIFGMIVYIAFLIWYTCRNVIGFRYLLHDRSHPNPLTLWIV